MLINQFNGGLNTRPKPQMIGINQAVVYENIDNSLGTLTPVKKAAPAGLTVNAYPFWYEAGNRWINGDGSYTPKVELARKVYEARVTGLHVYSTTADRAAGVAKPNTAPTVTAVPSPTKVATATITPESTISLTALPRGSYSYLLLNRNAAGYAVGLSVRSEPTGRSVIADNEYFVERGDDGGLREYEQIVGPNVNTRQIVTIGPILADINPLFGVDVFRVFAGKHRLVGTITSTTDILVDNLFDISGNAEMEVLDFAALKGTYQYVVTHVNAEGIESVPSELSAEAVVTNGGQITLGLPQYFETGGKTRIYRVGGNLTAFSLVEEVAGTTATYEDIVADVDIDGRVLVSQNYSVAPVMSTLVTAYGMLFGSVDNNLRYTNPGEPEYWPAAYSIPFPLTIKALAPVANGLLVMTGVSTYLVTGSGPLTLSVQTLRSDQGCIDRRSVQLLEGNAIWASEYGLCTSSGSSVDLVTKNALGRVNFGTVRSSALHNEVYYISYNNNDVLAVDYGYGGLTFKAFKFSIATGSTILTFFQDKSKLYMYVPGISYEAFASSDNEVLRYKSPRFIEGRATENKTYKKIYFYAENAVLLKVYINDELVANKQTVAGTKDSITLQVPQQLQRGFFIQFEVEGDGEVFELEYVAGSRQDE